MRRSRGASQVRNCGRPCLQPTFPGDAARLLPRPAAPGGSSTDRRRGRRGARPSSAETSSVTSDADERLLAPYRPVRRVARATTPPGRDCSCGLPSGESRVLVDARGASRRLGGVAARRRTVMSWRRSTSSVAATGTTSCCRSASSGWRTSSSRRARARVPLSVGETVTLGVSLRARLRGDWHAVGRGTGEWWLTDAGRPVLARGVVRRTRPPSHTAELLRSLAEGVRVRSALLVRGRGGRRRPSVAARPARRRGAAVRVAAAEPLATALLGPRSGPRPRRLRTADAAMRRLEPGSASTTTWPADVGGRPRAARRRRPRRHRLARDDGRVAPASRDRAPARAGRGCSRGGAAAVVLAAGLLWPTGAGGPATADDAQGATRAPARLDGGERRRARPTPPDARRRPSTVADADGSPPTSSASPTASSPRDSRAPATSRVSPSVMRRPAADRSPPARSTSRQRSARRPCSTTSAASRCCGSTRVAGRRRVSARRVMLHDDRWLLRDVHVAKQP